MTPDVDQACAILMLTFALWSAVRAASFSKCDRCWPMCGPNAHRWDVFAALVASALYLGAAVFFLVAEAMEP